MRGGSTIFKWSFFTADPMFPSVRQTSVSLSLCVGLCYTARLTLSWWMCGCSSGVSAARLTACYGASHRCRCDLYDWPLTLSCHRSAEHSRRPGGGAPRPPAHATGQHASGRGRVRTGERRRFCGSSGCSGRLWRGRGRQLSRALWLQGQAVPDQTDLPHRAGEVWTGKSRRCTLDQHLTECENRAVAYREFPQNHNTLIFWNSVFSAHTHTYDQLNDVREFPVHLLWQQDTSKATSRCAL